MADNGKDWKMRRIGEIVSEVEEILAEAEQHRASLQRVVGEMPYDHERIHRLKSIILKELEQLDRLLKEMNSLGYQPSGSLKAQIQRNLGR